jgi:hypothetical protein
MMMDNDTVENSEDLSSPTGGITDTAPPVLTPVVVKDVETLLDNPQRYEGQRVSVKGKVAKAEDDKSFFLKSGGLFNNRILVEHHPGSNEGISVEKRDEVLVTGTVRLDDQDAVLMADSINVQR